MYTHGDAFGSDERTHTHTHTHTCEIASGPACVQAALVTHTLHTNSLYMHVRACAGVSSLVDESTAAIGRRYARLDEIGATGGYAQACP